MFGDLSDKGEEWTEKIHIKEIDRYFTLEKKSVNSIDKLEGSFLVIEDNTERKKAVDKELYESMHDRLTGLYNVILTINVHLSHSPLTGLYTRKTCLYRLYKQVCDDQID